MWCLEILSTNHNGMYPSNKASISMEMKNNFLITQITHFMVMIMNRLIVI